MLHSPVRFHQGAAGFHVAACIAFQVLGTSSPVWGFACAVLALAHFLRSTHLERRTEIVR